MSDTRDIFPGKCSVRGCGARAGAVVLGGETFHALLPGARFVQLPGVAGNYLLCGEPAREHDNVKETAVAVRHAARWAEREVRIEDAAKDDNYGETWLRDRKRVAFRDFMEEMGLELQRAFELAANAKSAAAAATAKANG